jgi:hypothetical protein
MSGREARFKPAFRVAALKIEKKAGRQPGHLQVGHQLREVDRIGSLDGFDFDDDLVLDEQIDSQPRMVSPR